MLIALTGTPGTGKTSLANAISDRIEVVHINEFKECFSGFDEERGSFIVDLQCVERKVSSFSGVVEGHLSHHLPVDLVVVLRTHPQELIRRLKSRGYPPRKIMENAEAEAMGLIVSEAIDIHGLEKVAEIDTTGREVVEVVKDFWRAVSSPEEYPPRIDYTEEILKWY